MKKLSILICSLNSRNEKFLSRLKYNLSSQLTDEIEVLIASDNGEMTIGEKRQKLLEKAAGEYIGAGTEHTVDGRTKGAPLKGLTKKI